MRRQSKTRAAKKAAKVREESPSPLPSFEVPEAHFGERLVSFVWQKAGCLADWTARGSVNVPDP